jgi:hypothetical protein
MEPLERVVAVRDGLKGPPGEMRSQLERAAASVVANIAEAAGVGDGSEAALGDRRGERHRGGGRVEVAWRLKALSDGDRAKTRSLLLRTTWMLTAMIRR